MKNVTQVWIDSTVDNLQKDPFGEEPEVYFHESFGQEVKQSRHEAIDCATAEVITALASGVHIGWEPYQVDRLIAVIPKHNLINFNQVAENAPKEIQEFCQELCRVYQIPENAPAALLRPRFPETVKPGELITIFQPRDMS